MFKEDREPRPNRKMWSCRDCNEIFETGQEVHQHFPKTGHVHYSELRLD